MSIETEPLDAPGSFHFPPALQAPGENENETIRKPGFCKHPTPDWVHQILIQRALEPFGTNLASQAQGYGSRIRIKTNFTAQNGPILAAKVENEPLPGCSPIVLHPAHRVQRGIQKGEWEVGLGKLG